ESDVTAGTKATSIIAMMPITTSSSSNVNPPSCQATAGRGALARSRCFSSVKPRERRKRAQAKQQRSAKGRAVGFGNALGFIVNRFRRRHPASDKVEQRRYWGGIELSLPTYTETGWRSSRKTEKC